MPNDKCNSEHKLILVYRTTGNLLHGLCFYCREDVKVDLKKYTKGNLFRNEKPIYFRDYTKG